MEEWLNDVEPLTLKGRIAVPYTWWVGEVGSRFLSAIKEEKKILGNRCAVCGTVFVPPRKNCGRCFEDIKDWVELKDEGVVTAHCIVRYSYPLSPAEIPFAYAIIRLEGADVGFVHIVKENVEKLRNGIRVKAVFKEKRDGHILDIDSFRIL